jgi:putative peptide zinc metalloprotease protein
MTAIAEPPAPQAGGLTQAPLNRGEGVELLGPVHGSGYKDGAALVRRGDGQMVQLGPLMYGLLEGADGNRGNGELAAALTERLGRRFDEEHVVRLAEKLADQGLLAGTEHKAPPRRNPLLALRWKVLVTNPDVTRRLTAPFTVLFRPWLMVPILAAFVTVCWFVFFHKGVASATAQAFHSPGLLLLVFVLAVVSAGFHEIGHAAACRYGGARPAGMGMGLYLVWPAFYTDVTDSYRLPKRSRLRVDLGGLYFNAVVADVTLALWLLWRVDALLLLIAVQLLEMVKQLSPMIRADGYHILSDATGIPDLFSHMGPTLRRLLPGHRREPSALTGRARLLVTSWVLIIVPILLSLMLSAVLLLPKLATSAWDSGSHLASAIPHQATDGQILDVLASLLRLFALFMPVIGSALVTQRVVRMTASKARAWSSGNLARRTAALAGAAAIIVGLAWAWWPSGQYQPVRATDRGTLVSLGQLVSSPRSAARPSAQAQPATVNLTPGTHLAVSMIPAGGATKRHPALFVISQGKGKPAIAILSSSAPDPAHASGGTFSNQGGTSTTQVATPPPAAGTSSATTPAAGSGTATSPTPVQATAFPFQLPPAPGPGGTQALAVNTKDGGVMYDVAYSLVTVQDGAPVTQTNSAFAIAHCQSCTTVAVSFQVVLVVGRSQIIVPINAAGALNYNCPRCITTAIADQIVVTLTAQPSKQLAAQLAADLKQLNALPALGAGGTPGAVASAVAAVQQEIQTQLNNSGLLAGSPTTTSPSSSSTSSTSTSPSSSSTSTSSSSTSAPGSTASGSTAASPASPSSPPPASSGSGSSSTTPSAPAGSTTTTTTAPSSTTPTTTTTTTPSTSPPGSSGTATTPSG